MLQNKIYQKYFKDVLSNFFIILLCLSLIALTIRSVNFLELIVENGYSVSTYFKFSILNIFGLIPKFIPLSFFFSVFIFLRKHSKDSEFVILWTSGEKKTKIANLFLLISFFVLSIYILLSVLITPYTLNISRQLLSNQNFTSILPTIREQQFNDAFNSVTFFVEKKRNNELENIILNEIGNNVFKKFNSGSSFIDGTTIIAKKGIISKKNIFLLDGKIITTKEDSNNLITNLDLISFDELKINLNNFNTSVIKDPKLQETATIDLLNCLILKRMNGEFCKKDIQEEVIPVLNRRIILPIYLPIITLICSFLLFNKNRGFINEIKIFISCFLLLICTEIFLKYTGLNQFIKVGYIVLPLILFFILYSYLNLKLNKDIN